MGQSAYEAYDSAGKRKYLTKSEGKDFLRAAATLVEQERLLCEALYFLGCRVSELIQLTRDDIESPDWVVRIRCLKKRGKIVVRRVPIPESLAVELIGIQPAQDERLWKISRMTAWRTVKRAMRIAGIGGIHACPKGLRHGFGVRAALASVPVSVIQRWMGHSSPLTTAIYLAVRDDEERQMIAQTWL